MERRPRAATAAGSGVADGSPGSGGAEGSARISAVIGGVSRPPGAPGPASLVTTGRPGTPYPPPPDGTRHTSASPPACCSRLVQRRIFMTVSSDICRCIMHTWAEDVCASRTLGLRTEDGAQSLHRCCSVAVQASKPAHCPAAGATQGGRPTETEQVLRNSHRDRKTDNARV